MIYQVVLADYSSLVALALFALLPAEIDISRVQIVQASSYDEPEILRYLNRQVGPIGADAGHAHPRLY